MSPPRRRNAPRRKANSRRRPSTGRGFWGLDDVEDDEPEPISISDEPTAMVASLGPPPFPDRETIAEYHFAAVYEKAAALAVALAAANGLLEIDDE